MQPGTVVESLDVIEYERSRLGARIEREVVEPLGLERVEEALGQGVVETVPRAAHAADHAAAIEELLIIGAGVLRAAIAVVDKTRRGSTSPYCDLQSLHRERVFGALRGRPTDDLAGEDVEDDGEEEPSLASTHLGDVGDPESIGSVGLELSQHAVVSGWEVGSPRGDEAKATGSFPAQAFQAHQPRHAMLSCVVPRGTQRSIDSRRSVDTAVLAVHGVDAFEQRRILPIALAVRAFAPRVETAAGDLENSAELAYREGLPLLFDEPERHFCSSAK